jgi:hypothetical protein
MKRKHLDATLTIGTVIVFLFFITSDNVWIFLSSFFIILIRAGWLLTKIPVQNINPEIANETINKKEFWKLFFVKLIAELLPLFLVGVSFYFFVRKKEVWLSIFNNT